MMKKDYQKPTMNVVKMKMRSHLLNLSSTGATGLGEDTLTFDEKGGSQSSAWSRGNSVWDDDE